MIIKKFLGKTETEAIQLAKDELGSEAIVMNLKKVQPKGLAKLFVKGKVEVTAALDENPVYHSNEKKEKPDPEDKGVALELSKTNPMPDIVADENEEDRHVASIEERLNSLQKMIEKQMSEKTLEENKKIMPAEVREDKKTEETVGKEQEPYVLSKTDTCKELIRKQMIQNEVEQSIVDRLMDEIDSSLPKDASIDQILGAIYQKIILMTGQPYLIDKSSEQEPKYIFFLGSTGVGKTTTIAKIASRLKLNHKKNIVLVTADTYRIADRKSVV